MAKRQSLPAKRVKPSDSSDSCASDSEATRSFSVNAISSKTTMQLKENDFDGMPTLEKHWTLDNCATGHVSGNKALFDAWHGTAELILPNKMTIIGKVGQVTISMLQGGASSTLILRNVTYEPTLYKNLISHVKLLESGYQLYHQDLDGTLYVNPSTKHELKFTMQNNLYVLRDVISQSPNTSHLEVHAIATKSKTNDEKLVHWHNKLNHADFTQVAKVIKPILDPAVDSTTTRQLCYGCAQGQAKRISFRNTHHDIATKLLESLNGDLCGPIRPRTIHHEKYTSMFVDQASRYIFGKLLKKKNETTTHFTELTAHLDNQLRDSRIANIYTDGGGEYTSQEFRAACLSRGVTQKFTNADTPEENHLAEKTNEFVFNKIRVYMTLSGLPATLWGHCFEYVVYVYNHTPQELLNQRTPYEVLFGKPSRLHMLKTFGCLAFKFVPKSQRDGKLTNPATPCVFLGYATEQLGYKLWNPKDQTVTVSRSVTFDESKIRNANMFANSKFNHGRLSIPNYKLIEGVTSLEDLTTERFRTETTAEQTGNQATKPHHEAQTRRSDRKAKRPRRFEVNQVEFQAPQSPLAPKRINAPTTMAEFRSSPEREQWQQAMDDEYNSLTQNRVWELTELPKGRKALKCKWIWKVKYLANGAVERFKARLCVKGFLQIAGVDFTDTYAPVLRLDSLRVLCAVIATQDLEAVQMDIKTAFLNGNLDEEIFMEQPEGYTQPHSKHLVCLLKKSLYGLKQSPRQWHKKLHALLVKIGFRQCYKDQCIYVKRSTTNNCITYLAMYVDDIIIAG
ncbi:hypothetical protein Ae201684P_021073 [Aphanomyces euteiches]|uniref:Integrase catalytic domain-containing protein n=1 Tax=Aphanomyces euteiches TaxID=100861 RepID=A0A6G0WH06_9STRA|nr:hypothetical protein Ae201684_015310 [Aphanomyces euteiches]KAH9071935.1 hypothetical protein Ae201684P_021073 [Aphanomyces euteiches]